jgi:hypothetical protein
MRKMLWLMLIVLGFHMTRKPEQQEEPPDLDKLRDNGLI